MLGTLFTLVLYAIREICIFILLTGCIVLLIKWDKGASWQYEDIISHTFASFMSDRQKIYLTEGVYQNTHKYIRVLYEMTERLHAQWEPYISSMKCAVPTATDLSVTWTPLIRKVVHKLWQKPTKKQALQCATQKRQVVKTIVVRTQVCISRSDLWITTKQARHKLG